MARVYFRWFLPHIVKSLALLGLMSTISRAQELSFTITELYTEEENATQWVVARLKSSRTTQKPVYLGLVYKHPVFGDVPLSSGQLRRCVPGDCELKVRANNQTRRFFKASNASSSYFVLGINDPDEIKKILEQSGDEEDQEEEEKENALRFNFGFNRNVLWLKEEPKVFLIGFPDYAFNDSKYSRKLTSGNSFYLDFQINDYVTKFSYFNNNLSTRGFFTEDSDPPVESVLTNLNFDLYYEIGVFDGIYVGLGGHLSTRGFETNLTDDYSIVSTNYNFFGPSTYVRLDTSGLEFFELLGWVGMRSNWLVFDMKYSIGSASDTSEFKRGTQGSIWRIISSVDYSMKLTSPRWYFNNWLFNFGYSFEFNKSSFSGEVDYPEGYSDPSRFNEDSISNEIQHVIRFGLSREISI